MFKKQIGLFFLLVFVAPVHANWYQVEIIVFEYLYPDLDNEILEVNPEVPVNQNAIELFSYSEDDRGQDEVSKETQSSEVDDVSDLEIVEVESLDEVDKHVADVGDTFTVLPEEQHRLEGVYRVLKLSRDYRPLQHISWQQPALETNEARSVRLSLNKEPESLAEQLPAELLDVQLIDELAEPGDPIFDGFIRIRSSLFLHVDIDMSYFSELAKIPEPEALESSDQEKPLQAIDAEDDNDLERYFDEPLNYVRLKESRKIKLNEMHYFDHPLFGVIVQVSRIEVAEEQEQVVE